ncbi:MAG: GNAT family N-acetyltransferase [Beijerinckiaceae bacterium]
MALAKRLATRTPVGWKDNLVRLRGYSAMELKELRRHYEPRSLVIRAAEPDDAAAISELLLHAFGRNAEDQRADALRRNGGMICELAADYRGAIVGYIGFARVAAAIDGRPVEALAILPLAVESAFRELGIARRLVAAGLAEARASGADAVFVRGEASFFGKFGFSAKVAKRFMDQASEPILSVIEFSPGTLAGKTGSVAFPVSSGP